ncbi:MAG: xanthine dehydrogenase family protein molybdopterin-binding subunit, partial [Acidimicrobiia bacterium]|nr:xanthine dehydrogenase family protein molybdopterin-binding subunit [Acidimicrobiia bacterium]
LGPDDAAHAVFVRSPEAHARILAVDAEEARSMPGVLGVFAGTDLGFAAPMPNLFPSPLLKDSKQEFALAVDEVAYVGEAVVVVVAATGRQAVDAAETVFVDYEPLPAVVDYRTALEPGAPAAHTGVDSNLVATMHAKYGDVDEAFAAADRVIRVDSHQHRGAGASMEPRGVLAMTDNTFGQLVVWSSTQSPFPLRLHLAEFLGLELDSVRVVAPDVGGGFGPKGNVYAEEYVVAALALKLGIAIKWIETRREHFVATTQQRDQSQLYEVAITDEGRILGLRGRIIHDNGAYVPYGLVLPSTGLQLTPGPYVVPTMDIELQVVYTNKTPTSPIRGAGRPYATFAIERVVDAIAREIGVDRAEARRRNFIPAGAFPYERELRSRDGNRVTIDSGDYELALDNALAASDGFQERRALSEAKGRLRGLGIASYTEDTGLGPFEGARVEVLPSGHVVVDTGAATQGQGHSTVFAQLVSSELGVDPSRVRVRGGDTEHYGYGISTVASRTAVTAGSSVHLAARAVADLARTLAAEHLEASEADLILEDGYVRVVGQPGAEISLGALAKSMQGRGATPLPGGQQLPGLAADRAFQMHKPGFAFGTHVAEVEIDSDTGFVDVVRYVVAHDCGIVINPMIVDGQIDGGVAHGLGNALSERVVFSADGQPVSTTFMDYRIMSAVEMPHITKIHSVTPSPFNPLGVKGAGEGGTIPAAAAVVSAVEDALAPYGAVIDRYPITPEMVFGLIERSQT